MELFNVSIEYRTRASHALCITPSRIYRVFRVCAQGNGEPVGRNWLGLDLVAVFCITSVLLLRKPVQLNHWIEPFHYNDINSNE